MKLFTMSAVLFCLMSIEAFSGESPTASPVVSVLKAPCSEKGCCSKGKCGIGRDIKREVSVITTCDSCGVYTKSRTVSRSRTRR